MMHGKQLANEVKMARVLYRKCGLCSTHSFWNLSGINALPKTVAWYDSKRGILVQYSVTWWTALINFRTSFINHFTLSCYSRKLFEDWLYHHCKQSWYFDMTQCESYCHWFDCFSFFRSSGVVENYQAKLIRDLLSLGVVQKQTKSPMNGLVLHVKNYLKNQFSTKKLPRLRPSHISPEEHTVKTSVAASRNIAWFSKRDMQLLHYVKT